MSVITVTKDNFKQIVSSGSQKILLDFWAPWCGPCRMLSPVIEEISGEHPDLKTGKVNIDEQPELADAFGVMSIPTIVVIQSGKEIARSVGARPKQQIEALLR